MLAHQQGSSLLSFDGRNAFNSLKRSKILPALAEIVPVALPYVVNLYALEPPKLLYKMRHGGTRVVASCSGVQQGCTLGPLCFSAGSLPILRAFEERPPVEGAQLMAFIDDLVVVCPPERAADADAVEKVTTWMQDQLEPCGIQLNREKTKMLPPQGTKPQDLPEPTRTMLRRTGISVAPDGMRVVGVPVRSAEYQRQQALEAMRGEPTELLRSLAQMEDSQASFQILRLSAATRMNFLLRTLPPDVVQESVREFDALAEEKLAAIVAGPDAHKRTPLARSTPPTAARSPLERRGLPAAVTRPGYQCEKGGTASPALPTSADPPLSAETPSCSPKP